MAINGWILAWTIICWAVAVVSIIWVGYKLYQTNSQMLIDYFNQARWVNLITHFVAAIVTFALNLAIPHDFPYSLTYLYMFDVNIYWFIMLNFSSWIVLITHISFYSKIKEDKDYFEQKLRIKKIEKINVYFVLAIHVTSFTIMILIAIFQFAFGCDWIHWEKTASNTLGVCQVSVYLQNFLFYSKGALFVTFFILLLILIVLFSYYLDKNLNYYYRTIKMKILALFLMSALYLGGTAIFDLGMIFSKKDLDFRREFDNGQASGFITMGFTTLVNITFLIYAYLNMTLIDYRQYLEDIMQGYGLKSHFHEEASIFLKLNKDYKSRRPTDRNDEESTSDAIKAIVSKSLSQIFKIL